MSCQAHPDVAETHACTQCEKRWCQACIVPLRTTHRASCPGCGHLVVAASPILAPTDKLDDAVARVRSMEGTTTAFAFAVAFMVSRWVPALVVIYVAALVGYYFHIIRYVGDGHQGLPGPSDAVDSWSETVGIFLQAVLCLAISQLPLFIYFCINHDFPSTALTIAFVIVGQIYMPAAILATVLTNRMLAVAWPPAWIAIIARSRRRYAEFTALWLVSVAVWFAIYAVTSVIVDGSLSLAPSGEAPLRWFGFGALAASFVWNLFAFAQASLVGLYLRENRDQLGLVTL
jgi:hypothetical protein